MPLFMDLHKDMHGISTEELEHVHMQDIEVQDTHGVKIHKFYVNKNAGTLFCLMEAPNKEACEAVHKEAHGNLACEVIEVQPSDVSMFMGEAGTDRIGMAVHPDGKSDSAVRSFLFTDMVGSTDLNQEMGDTRSVSILRKHNTIVRDALQIHSGEEVKHTGDGIMACFISASKAVQCAINIQQKLEEHRNQEPQSPLHIRIGINAGEPVTEGDDFFGTAVQLAARVCDAAETDQILVSTVMKDLCAGKNVAFEALGSVELKGFKEPQFLHEIRF